jgi:hypothetical protein
VNSLKELVYKLQCYKGYYISDKEREHEKNSVLNEEGRDKHRQNGGGTTTSSGSFQEETNWAWELPDS